MDRGFEKMKMVKLLGIALFIGLFVIQPTSFAQDSPKPEEIIAKSRLAFYYAADDMKAKISMELIDKDGRKRIREMTMLRKDDQDGGQQKYFIYFHQPTDVKDMTFMVYKYPDKDADRWLFIPAIDLVKRIAANDKFSSFVGSDFTYEDISGRNPAEDTHTFVRKDTLEGKACFVVESTPKEASEYAKRISWIDTTNFLPLKEEFYDKQNELYRQFEAGEIKEIDGIPTITQRVVKNIKSGHRTEVSFEEIKYNLGIGDDIFSERYLRKPPLQWIK
jgi:outer membrane lipoprotein-sorting protein